MRISSFLLIFCLIFATLGSGHADPEEKLMNAVKDADIAVITEIIETDPRSINTLNTEGEAPLHWAAINGNVQVIDLLISNGADVNIRSADEWTPLHWVS